MNRIDSTGGRLRGARPFLLLLAATAAASLWPEPFLLTRDGLARGELWRLWTGHLAHAGPTHYALDVGAALLLLPLARGVRYLLAAAPAVGLAVFAAYPGIDAYCGLSGLLHGWTVLVVLGLAADRTRRPATRTAALLLGAGVAAKAVFETWTAASVFTTDAGMGVPTVHGAHLAGVATALAWTACRALFPRPRLPARPLPASSGSAPAPAVQSRPVMEAPGGDGRTPPARTWMGRRTRTEVR